MSTRLLLLFARSTLAAATWFAGSALAGASEPAAAVVVVTATRHAITTIEAPASMSVVTRRDIEQRGADNLLGALRGELGVSLQGRAIGGRQVLSLRGLDSKHTLFLVNGRRVGASDGVIGHSDLQYDWVAVEDIERVEIVRGPMSVLYGSEALGGVVNVITREPSGRWEAGVTAEATAADGGRGGDGQRIAARATGPLAEGLLLRTGASRTRRGAIAATADPRISELEGRDKDEGWLGLDWHPGQGQRVQAEFAGGHEVRHAEARERSGARRFHTTINLIDRRTAWLGWEADWTGASALATQLRAYRTTVTVENQRTAGVAINPPQRIDDRVFDGQARWRQAAHAWTAGFEARDEGLRDPGLPGGESVARHRSLYLQDELTLAKGLTATLGLRHDRHSLYGNAWSPRAYLVWQLDPSLTLKGGYGHGFKAPNLKQIVPGARAEGPNLFLGNPDLRPETNDGLEFGLGWRQGAYEAQVIGFEQRLVDLIEIRQLSVGPLPGTGTYTYENLSRARIRGVEASVAAKLAAGFSLALNYAYLDAHNGSGQRLERRPRHNATVAVNWQHGPWRAGLRAEYSAAQVLPAATAGAPPQPVPDLGLIGASLIRTLPAGLELTLGVDNLTNLRLIDKSPLFQQAERPRTWRLQLRGHW